MDNPIGVRQYRALALSLLHWPQQHQRNLAADVALVARVIRRDTHQVGPDARAVRRSDEAGRCPLALTFTLDLDSWVRQQVEIPRGRMVLAVVGAYHVGYATVGVIFQCDSIARASFA